ncbi:MAG: AAA family ATPase [Chthonomonadales bacterium]|nr:AAA family ATPase [Chthonomonadales bacterium]
MRVLGLEVEGLFGLWDHRFELDRDEHVTIIYGRNGVGKTTLLRLVQAFIDRNWWYVADTRFDRLSVVSDDNRRLCVRRSRFDQVPDADRQSCIELTLSFEESDNVLERDIIRLDPPPSLVEEITELAESSGLQLRREGPIHWVDPANGRVWFYGDILAELGAWEITYPHRDAADRPWLADAVGGLRAHYLGPDRVLGASPWYHDKPERVRSFRTAEGWASEIRERLVSARAAYAKHAQELDATFPSRVLEAMSATTARPASLSALLDLMDGVNRRRNRLAEVGLLEATTSDLAGDLSWVQSDAGALALLNVYLSDALDKLDCVADLDAALSGLVEQVNERLIRSRLAIDRDRGLSIVNQAGVRIPPGRLSSGEQHMLVMMAELYLRAQPGDLLLIDEPELSQHVEWQKAFVEHLIGHAQALRFDAIVATHSPDIVQGHRALLRGLGESPETDSDA